MRAVVPIRRTTRPGRTATNPAIAALIVIGLASAWLASVSSVENSVSLVGSDGKPMLELVKTPLYYGAHGLAICSVIAAGLLSSLYGRWSTISLGARLAFYVLILEALVWAAIAYTNDELLSSKIFGATGPFVWITLLFVVAGTDRSLWVYIDPAIRTLAYASSALAIRTLITTGYTPYHGFTKYTFYTLSLIWLAGWTLLSATQIRGWRMLPRTLPFICLMPVAVCSQTRSLILLSCLLVILFVALRARERGSMAHAVPVLISISILGCGAAVLIHSIVPQTMNASVSSLSARLQDDTRSGQYTDFFSTVPVSDLLLGRGPTGTWYWTGFGEYQFFDNGYLWMLFIGGVPTLICYFRIVIWPAIRAVSIKPRGADGAAVCLAVLWGISLTGLSVFILPAVDITSYVISLFVGRCHLLLAERSVWNRTNLSALTCPAPTSGNGLSQVACRRPPASESEVVLIEEEGS
jgi:hypothetical protein